MAFAPLMVAMAKACIAGKALASALRPLANKAAKRISLNMSKRLLLAAPSVPKATFTPLANKSTTGAMPLASFKFELGQCAIWQPYAANISIS